MPKQRSIKASRCPANLIEVSDRRVKGGFYCRERSARSAPRSGNINAATGALAGVGIVSAATAGGLLATSASNQLQASRIATEAKAERSEIEKKLADLRKAEEEAQKQKEEEERKKPLRKYEIAGSLLSGAVEGAIPGAVAGGPAGAGIGALAGLAKAGGVEAAKYIKERNQRVGAVAAKTIEIGSEAASTEISKRNKRKDAYYSGLEYAKRYDAKRCGRGWIADDLECKTNKKSGIGIASRTLGGVAKKIERKGVTDQTPLRQKILESRGMPTRMAGRVAKIEEKLKIAAIDRDLGPLSTELQGIDTRIKNAGNKARET